MDPFFSSRKFDPSELRSTLMSLPTQHEVEYRSPRNSMGNIEVTTEITTQMTPRHVKERTRSYPFSLSAASRQAFHHRDHSADDAKQRSKSYTPLSTNENDPGHHHPNAPPARPSRKTVRFSLEDYRNKNKKRGEITSCSSDNSSRYTFTFADKPSLADKPLPTAPERNQSTSSQGSVAGPLNANPPSSSFAKRHSTSGPFKLLTHSFSSSSRRQSMTPISPQTRVDSLSPSLEVNKRQSTPTLATVAGKRQSSLLSTQQQLTPPSSSGFVAPRRQSSLAVLQQGVARPTSSSMPVDAHKERSSSTHSQHKPLPPPPSPQLEKPSPMQGHDMDPPRPVSRDLPPTPDKTHFHNDADKRDSLMEESWMEDISEEEYMPLATSGEDNARDYSPPQDMPPQRDMPVGDLNMDMLIELDMPDDETVQNNTQEDNLTEGVVSEQTTPRPESVQRFAQVEDVPEDVVEEDMPQATFLEDETSPEEDTTEESMRDDVSDLSDDDVALGDMEDDGVSEIDMTQEMAEENAEEENVSEVDMTEYYMAEEEMVEEDSAHQPTAEQEMPDQEMHSENGAEQETTERSVSDKDLPRDESPEELRFEAGPPKDESSEIVQAGSEVGEEGLRDQEPPQESDVEKASPDQDIMEESEVAESSNQEEAVVNPPKAQIMSCQRLTIRSFRTPPILQWSNRHGIRQLGTRYRAIPKHHCEEIVMQITSYIPRRVAVQLHYIRPGWKILRCRLKVPVVLILVPSSRRVPQRVYTLLCVGQGRQPGEEVMAGIDLEKIDRGKRRMRLEADMKFYDK